MSKIILKKPIELSSSVRDADGVPLAFAKTVEGGSAVVGWKNESWVLVPQGSFTVSDVMKSPEMRTSVRFSKTLNEYIFYGKPESQLPSEMEVSDHQLNLLKKIPPKKIEKIIEKYGNILGLKLRKEKKDKNYLKKNENGFLKFLKKYELKYPITSIIIIFIILFYILPKLFEYLLNKLN